MTNRKGIALLLTALAILVLGQSLDAKDSTPAPHRQVNLETGLHPIVPEGMVEIQVPADWNMTDDVFPCSFDPTATCYYEPDDDAGSGEWVPADTGWSTEPDGTTHEGCLLHLGDTSTVVCEDGYTASS